MPIPHPPRPTPPAPAPPQLDDALTLREACPLLSRAQVQVDAPAPRLAEAAASLPGGPLWLDITVLSETELLESLLALGGGGPGEESGAAADGGGGAGAAPGDLPPSVAALRLLPPLSLFPKSTFYFEDSPPRTPSPEAAGLGRALGRLLAGSPALELLAIDDVALSPADARALGEGLAGSGSLRVLDVHESGMGAEAVGALAESGLAANGTVEARRAARCGKSSPGVSRTMTGRRRR